MFEFTFSSTDLSLSGIELSSTETLDLKDYVNLLEKNVSCNVFDGVSNALEILVESLLVDNVFCNVSDGV